MNQKLEKICNEAATNMNNCPEQLEQFMGLVQNRYLKNELLSTIHEFQESPDYEQVKDYFCRHLCYYSNCEKLWLQIGGTD